LHCTHAPAGLHAGAVPVQSESWLGLHCAHWPLAGLQTGVPLWPRQP
jgi:hypothetical protein